MERFSIPSTAKGKTTRHNDFLVLAAFCLFFPCANKQFSVNHSLSNKRYRATDSRFPNFGWAGNGARAKLTSEKGGPKAFSYPEPPGPLNR